MTDKAPFSVEKEGHLAWLILDRPEKRNTHELKVFCGLNGTLRAIRRRS